MALTRLCPFCLEALTACVCPDTDPPPLVSTGGFSGPEGLKVLRTAAEGARETAERKLALLRAAVQKVLDDEESGKSGWGPDVTMVTVLREAMEASA